MGHSVKMPEPPIPLKPHSVWRLSDSIQLQNLPGCDAGMKVNKQGAMSNKCSFFQVHTCGGVKS